MKVVIYGAGGHGRVVLDILQQSPGVSVLGFLDSDPRLHGKSLDGLPVVGDVSSVPRLRDRDGLSGAVVAIGDNRARASLATHLEEMGLSLVNAVHPTAILARSVRLGQGVVVSAGAVLGPHVQVGANVIINTGAIVDHEDVIGGHVHLAPGTVLAGRVTVGTGALVGMRSAVVPGVTIGRWTVVAAGSVVTRDLPDEVVAGGSPARLLRPNRNASRLRVGP